MRESRRWPRLGQAAFLLMVVALGATVRAVRGVVARTEWLATPGARFGTWPSYGATVSWFAAIVGGFWLLERIGLSARLLAQGP